MISHGSVGWPSDCCASRGDGWGTGMTGISKTTLLRWPGVQSCGPGASFLSVWLFGLPGSMVAGFQEDTDPEPKEKPQRHFMT